MTATLFQIDMLGVFNLIVAIAFLTLLLLSSYVSLYIVLLLK